MRSPPLDPPVSDVAPSDGVLTGYDEEHLVTYLRLLDAEGELRALVGLAEDGSPLIQFMDERTQPTWTMR